MTRKLLAFDVNETLLDVQALEPLFERAFGERKALREWFLTLLHYSLVTTVIGKYIEFSELARGALQTLAEAGNIDLGEDLVERITSGMLQLPAYPDVVPSLERLRDAGFRLAALTNSSQKSVDRQLRFAALDGYFEARLSVDMVRRYKPAPEVYRAAAERLGVAPSHLRLIAAHGWDVAGALNAGCAAAFVARPGKTLFPLGPRPDITGKDLAEVAGKIIGQEPS